MTDTLVIIALSLFLFLCSIVGFYTGLRVGFRLSKGNEPPKIKNPVQVIVEAKERKATEKAAKEEVDELRAFEENDGYTEQERVWVNEKSGGDGA